MNVIFNPKKDHLASVFTSYSFQQIFSEGAFPYNLHLFFILLCYK